jgi:peptidyl-dipeptidase A
VRGRLQETYGKDKVPDGKPIPAHLLGNLWAQEWGNLFEMMAPEPGATKAIDLDAALKARKTDEKAMVKYGEGFFSSLGLPELPKSFWERSMFTKPRDREVVCHASAWDVDQKDDLRIKMCIQVNEEDFTTIHHELGHNYYQRAYKDLSTLFLNSANDGFHEALGDLISLSVTPSYLKQLGLIDQEPTPGLNPLMKRALDKIAFLPWGLLVDKWRWGVFSGQIKPGQYNQAWWDLRLKYQGVAPAVERTEADFDPGAKYHIPANVPYTRYFLAAVLQFQFHRALCKQIGHTGPLQTCSIYNNKEAGARIAKMMEMGASRPWPEALKVLTGEDRMDATAILEYFAPLHQWLKKQNEGRTCGW